VERGGKVAFQLPEAADKGNAFADLRNPHRIMSEEITVVSPTLTKSNVTNVSFQHQ
jgi:hypothetical protein